MGVLYEIFSDSVGASGDLMIVAPLPRLEMIESPYTLVAITYAETDDPHGNKNGAFFNVVTLTVQLVYCTTADNYPLH